jgi:hypothetical protein
MTATSLAGRGGIGWDGLPKCTKQPIRHVRLSVG